MQWNFQEGWGVQAKKPTMGGVCIVSGTAQLQKFMSICFFAVNMVLFILHRIKSSPVLQPIYL